MAHLALPDPRLHRSFLAMVAELADEGRGADATTMLGQDIARHGASWHTADGFAAYVAGVRRQEREAPPGFVTHTTWWWVDGEEVLGRIDLRHELNEHLLEVGGHVGYDVRPTARRLGHATAMLGALLPRAAERGIVEVLVTCDDDNEGSRRAIERNGGVLEDRRGVKLRFWVPTG